MVDTEQFKMWFFKQFVLSTSDLVGPIVLIGDNLGSHFSKKVLQYCDENEIRFLCLPPNSAHLCQPLDMAVFRQTKTGWPDILDGWRKESQCADNLQKTIFPSLLCKLICRLKPKNLGSGFCATGIAQPERNEFLKRLPGMKDTTKVHEFSFNQSVLDVLKENCGVGQKKQENRNRGKRIEPGKQVGSNDSLSEDKGNAKPTSSKQKARNERKVSRKINEDENDDVWICNEYKEEWDDNNENHWIFVIYVVQKSICNALDFAMKLMNFIDGCLSDV